MLKEKIKLAIEAAAVELFGSECGVMVEISRPEERFGDFATNVAMKLSGILGKNPREIAESMAEKLRADVQFTEVGIAGPGFINIRLSDATLVSAVQNDVLPQVYKGQNIVAEYSDPNPFKVLHAGHLYTSLVGDSVARLLEAGGATVHRVNFGGDVGLHVARCMWGIVKVLGGELLDKLDEIPEATRLDWISQQYVIGNNAYEEDELARQEIIAFNKRVYALHSENDHESPFAKIYWKCRQWSYDGFNALYEQLKMVPFEKYYPESVTTPPGITAVNEGIARGVFEYSDGAVVYKGEDAGLHTRVFINSHGLPTYEAKDLGLAVSKWEDYHFDMSLMITGNDIIEYMKVVLAALGHLHPDIKERTRHLTHGMIKLAGGVKMSSRKGNILRAIDILNAANEANKQASGKDDANVALGAVKYAFLKQRIGGDIIYDPEESVSLVGNSGPYLQYAHARARAILRKAVEEHGFDGEAALQADERTMVRKLSEWPDIFEVAAMEFAPHHIASYLHELAQEFNRFYEKNRVIGDERARLRLWLVDVYAYRLKQGLSLLGINAPENM